MKAKLYYSIPTYTDSQQVIAIESRIRMLLGDGRAYYLDAGIWNRFEDNTKIFDKRKPLSTIVPSCYAYETDSESKFFRQWKFKDIKAIVQAMKEYDDEFGFYTILIDEIELDGTEEFNDFAFRG